MRGLGTLTVTTMSLLFLGLAMPAGEALAQQNSPTAGGSGGTPFSNSCDTAGDILVGAKGKFGAFVDRVQGICATVNEILMPEDDGATAAAGGSGGTEEFEQRCPSGHAVGGLRVKTGSFVDSLRIRCGRLQADGTIGGLSTHPIRAGGSGGGASTDLNCPNNLPARGLRGRSGSFIDRIGLRCDVATVHATNSTDPRPDLRVAIRDYPSVVTNRNDRITYRVELWNVGGAAAPATASTVDINAPAGSRPTFQRDPNFAIAAACVTTGATAARCTAGGAIPPRRRMVVRVTMVPPAGPAVVSAQADVPAQVAEINETNNRDERTLTAVLGP